MSILESISRCGIGIGNFCGSGPFNARRGGLLWRRSLWGVLVAVLVALGSVGMAGAECIDYGEYMRWVGGVAVPDTTNNMVSVVTSGTHAFIADYDFGLQVIDIANPADPQIVGSADTPGDAHGVATSGGLAYVTDSVGLQVFDITNPADPQIVGSVDTPGSAFKVTVSGTLAYVADGGSGLQVIDIANPAAPQIVGGVDTPTGSARGVTVSGTIAYVSCGVAGL